MARVLVVTNTPHQPATSGYSLRVSAVIAALTAAGHDVATYAIRGHSGRPHLTPRTSRSVAARSRVLLALLRLPSAALCKWYSARACDALHAFGAQWRPDVVILESSYLAPYRVLFGCPVIFDLHNIESMLVENFGGSRRGLVSAAARLEARLMRRVEAAIPAVAFGVVVVSQTDRDALLALAPGADNDQAQRGQAPVGRGKAPGDEVVVAPNGVSDAAFEVPANLAAEPSAVFIAHLGWRPNIDGALWLANEVWPLVRAMVPEAQLQLVGRSPAPAVLALASAGAGVSVHADVDSVLPFLAEAAVATAPLWTAGGTRLKILEALATGTPVVSTSLGALGLAPPANSLGIAAEMNAGRGEQPGPTAGIDPQHSLTIADTPADFAKAMAAHLQDPAKSEAARRAAEPFRWCRALKPLVAMVAQSAS